MQIVFNVLRIKTESPIYDLPNHFRFKPVADKDSLQVDFFRRYAKKLIQDARDDGNFPYWEIAERLQALGVDIDTQALINKVNRNAFSFVFALQLLSAMGKTTLPIPTLPDELKRRRRRSRSPNQ